MTPSLVFLGSGYTLTRLAVAQAQAGRDVLAATRDSARREELVRAGARVSSLEDALLQTQGAHVVVSVPPEAGLDGAIASALAARPPARLVYLSSTGVYGSARGAVDEDTPVDVAWPSSLGRLEAESRYLPLGAMVLRIAGIYGPGRGAHSRLLSGNLRLPERGGRISRVHVDDLGAAILAGLEQGTPGALYCVADDRAAPLEETVTWLAHRLAMSVPPRVPLETLHESLRGDRAISNARLKELGWLPRYPDFTVGFAAVLKEEGRTSGEGDIVIRPVFPDEVEAFRAMRLRSLTEHPEAFGSSFEEESQFALEVFRGRLESTDSQRVLGAYDGTRLVAVVGVRREPRLKSAHKAFVWGMYVAEEARSRGVGRRLLVAILAEGRKLPGVEQLLLAVVSGNAAAHALYRSVGFQTYGVEPRALKIGGAYVDEELMVLTL
ncbi:MULTISPECIES: GNAT family N-acetyltransferase [unclassified Myxococcus]|uniref:GNAT family N-acetyltransferase n=1 Tax=unclassified Myxococcus TaxID=2648731 RepID=UPI00157A9E15|nr:MULTISPECIES: GNAT family N-acetyltransferase [unclassified Myxococcus]NTX07977.1 GNAT family N-acetyltransferase [Myxococcus sp. CA040A]NTX40607.1 GNAT family N-acetyltransferase [Myxococcus sp. CA033]